MGETRKAEMNESLDCCACYDISSLCYVSAPVLNVAGFVVNVLPYDDSNIDGFKEGCHKEIQSRGFTRCIARKPATRLRSSIGNRASIGAKEYGTVKAFLGQLPTLDSRKQNFLP